MVVPGGEVAFVSRMIDESVVLKEQVQWYTSMLGKASSIVEVVERLKTVGADNWAVTEFVQGQKTRRWAVGWSWGDMRPRQVSRNSSDVVGVLTCGLVLKRGLIHSKDGRVFRGELIYLGCRSQHRKFAQASSAIPMRISLFSHLLRSSRATQHDHG